jgi:hypothetical protein
MSSNKFICSSCDNCIDRYLFDCAIRKVFPEIIQKLEINTCNNSYVCRDCATYDIPLIPSYLLSHITEICVNETPKFINSYAVRANGYISIDVVCKMIHTSNMPFANAIKEKFNSLLENENIEYHIHENEECDIHENDECKNTSIVDNENEEETQPLITNDEQNANEEHQPLIEQEEYKLSVNNEDSKTSIEKDKLNLHEQFFYSTKRFIREMNTYQLYLYSIHSETESMKNLHKITSCTEFTHINATEFTENDMIDYEKTNRNFITQLSNVYKYGRDNECDCEEHSVSEESSECECECEESSDCECACEESSDCECACEESSDCEENSECKSYTKNNEETNEETNEEETNEEEETNKEDITESDKTTVEESNKTTLTHPSVVPLPNSSCIIA